VGQKKGKRGSLEVVLSNISCSPGRTVRETDKREQGGQREEVRER